VATADRDVAQEVGADEALVDPEPSSLARPIEPRLPSVQ
jgi:hypothetical protein